MLIGDFRNLPKANLEAAIAECRHLFPEDATVTASQGGISIEYPDGKGITLANAVQLQQFYWGRGSFWQVKKSVTRRALMEENDRLKGQIEAWENVARQAGRNSAYYREIVENIGELFGVAAKTQDDGNIVPDVLCAKVYELCKERFEKPNPATEVPETGTVRPKGVCATHGVQAHFFKDGQHYCQVCVSEAVEKRAVEEAPLSGTVTSYDGAAGSMTINIESVSEQDMESYNGGSKTVNVGSSDAAPQAEPDAPATEDGSWRDRPSLL